MASSESVLFYLQAIAIVCCGLVHKVDGITDDALATKITKAEDRYYVTVEKKSSVLLNCSVLSTSRANSLHMHWYKGESKLKTRNYGPAIRVFQNGSLYIRHARSKHEGPYTCLANNNIGTVIVRNVRLQLAKMAKNFSIEPSSVVGYVGGAARFECEIHTVPPSIYSWQKDSQSLPQQDNKYTTLPSGVLQINDLQETDTGFYRCVTSRGELHNLPDEIDDIHLMHSKQAHLRIRKSGRNRRPVLLGSVKNVTVTQGETAILECLVDSKPRTSISWYRFDGQVIRSDFVFLFGVSNLKLVNVEASDEGTYVCLAKSPAYKDLKTFINLTVYRPPVLKSKLVSQRWPVDRIVIFTCDVDGNPQPDITWFFNGKQITSKDKFQVKSGNILNIINAGLEESGYYQCLASNVVGKYIATARLEIFIRDGVPPAPTVTEVRAVSDTSIFLKWKQPGSRSRTNILTTAVYYQKLGGTGGKQTLFTHFNNVTLVDLEPHTNYTIEVKSYNSKGTSVSNSTVVQTLQSKPAAQLHVEPINKTAVLLSWRLNGDISRIKSYDIELRDLQDGRVEQQANLNADALEYLLSNLNDGLMYEVTLTVNGVGMQTFGSVTVEFGTLEKIKPVVPQDVHGDVVDLTSVRLTWLYPSSENVSFLVCYQLDAELNQKKRCNQSNKSRLVISGLQPFHAYRFYVSASLDEELSPASEACVVQLGKQDVPSAPVNLNYRLLSPEAIELHWSPPLTPNGPITSYVIFYVPNSNDAMWKNFTKPGTLTQMQVKELKAAVYYFKVRACNRAGDGDMSRVVSVILDDKRLQSVKNLGIIIGLSVGGVCILCCITALLCWKFCNRRRTGAHKLDEFNGNGYISGHANGSSLQTPQEELQHWEKTPMLTCKLPENEHSDAKGAGTVILMPNGLHMNGVLQELKNGHKLNGHVPRLLTTANVNCHSTEEHHSLIAAMLASTDGSQVSNGHESRISAGNSGNTSHDSLDDIDRTDCEDDGHGSDATFISCSDFQRMRETDIIEVIPFDQHIVHDTSVVNVDNCDPTDITQTPVTCSEREMDVLENNNIAINSQTPVTREDLHSMHNTDFIDNNTSKNLQTPVTCEDLHPVHEKDFVDNNSMNLQSPVSCEDGHLMRETGFVYKHTSNLLTPMTCVDLHSMQETDIVDDYTSTNSPKPVTCEDLHSVLETDLIGNDIISPDLDTAKTQERPRVTAEGNKPCCDNNLCLLPTQTVQQPTTSCSCGSGTASTSHQAAEATCTSSTQPRDHDRPPTPPPPLSVDMASPSRLKSGLSPGRKKRNGSRGAASSQLHVLPHTRVHNGTTNIATECVSRV